MKGLVFTELLDMVEDKFGPEVSDKIIELSDLESGGAYTSVGTYDHGEILQLVTHLSQESDIPVPALVQTFGRHLVSVFYAKFPDFFKVENVQSFLKSIDSYIHVEVKKLYPKAELPKFEFEENGSDLILKYSSSRPFADLAEGLILATLDHFGTGETLTIVSSNEDGTSRDFKITKAA